MANKEYNKRKLGLFRIGVRVKDAGFDFFGEGILGLLALIVLIIGSAVALHSVGGAEIIQYLAHR